MTNQKPSINPANNDTLLGMLNHTFKKMLQRVDGMLPAKVIAVLENGKYVKVQLQIKITGTDGEEKSRGTLAKIPVFTLGSNFLIRFPVKEGDAGWIFANDRDVSLYLESNEEMPANTDRIKSFSDGVFFPQAAADYIIDPENIENLTIQSADGLINITLSGDTISLNSPNIQLNGDVVIDGELIVADRIVGQSDIASGGNITAAGDITPNTPIPPL